jgi:hypothetical protein
MILKKQQEDNTSKEKELATTTTKPSHSLEEYTGTYEHKGYGKINVEVKNDSLWANFTREKAFLKHTHYDIFKPHIVTDNTVNTDDDFGFNFNFKTNDLGDIDGVDLKLEPTLDPLFFSRSPSEIIIDEANLNTFVGTYTLSGAELKVTLENGTLKLLVPQQPKYTLTPVTPTEFIIKGLSGYKAEFSGKNLILHQPNGTFKAVKN